MNHERLECYQMLVEVAARIAKLTKRWPRGYGDLEDQIERAISSSILNVAEGNGKRAAYAERHRFFNISLGSIAEVSACLDLCLAFGLVFPLECASLKSLLRGSYARIRKLP